MQRTVDRGAPEMRMSVEDHNEGFRTVTEEEARFISKTASDVSYFLRKLSKMRNSQWGLCEVSKLRRTLNEPALKAGHVKRRLRKAAQDLGLALDMPESTDEEMVYFRIFIPDPCVEGLDRDA